MWKYLRSIRFFFLVAALLVVFSILASLIPQSLPAEEYRSRYGPAVSTVIQALRFDSFYRSPLFFVLGGLLELNLLACSIPRLASRVKRGTKRPTAYAADVIHLGLALAIVGGVVSFAFREEHQFAGRVGERFAIESGDETDPAVVEAVDARERTTGDGVVVSWEIDLRAGEEQATVVVNDPARLGPYRAYFRHFEERGVASLVAEQGELTLRRGEGLESQNGTVLLFDGFASDGDGLFTVNFPEAETERYKVEPGGRIFGLEFQPVGTETLIGFSLSRDPGRPLLLVGLVVVAVGLALFAAHRLQAHRAPGSGGIGRHEGGTNG